MEGLSFRQILIGEQMVGQWGLKELFDELHAQGRAPEAELAPLLLERVERDNYVFPVVGCDACAKVCKRGAIRFPPREMLARMEG